MTSRRERLRSHLILEEKIQNLKSDLDHCTPKDGALFLIYNAIPCILHMENRVGIKILTMLLVEGLSNVKEKTIFENIQHEGPRIHTFLNRIAIVTNREILGNDENPSQWEVPYDKKSKVIGLISLCNNRTRKFINNLGVLISICTPEGDRRTLWNNAISAYKNAMELVRQKEDFTDYAIFSYQREADKFFNYYVSLHGLAGVTNYIHMIGSGHIAQYMFKWRNLYRHSQQGWEALNWLIKTFYFRRTGHRGAVNQGKGTKFRLKPIGRYLQRRMMWVSGLTGEAIQHFKDATGNEGEEEAIESTLDLLFNQ